MTKRTFYQPGRKGPFVTADWLRKAIKNKKKHLKILDCSWYMPNTHGPWIEDYKQVHVIGTKFFDIDKIADQYTKLPHMLPTEEQFEEQVSELGLTNEDHIICYDTSGSYIASARVWWTFRLFGHDNIFILDKGFVPSQFPPEYLESGLPTPKQVEDGSVGFITNKKSELLVNINQIIRNLKSKEFTIIDARSSARFNAEVDEPREGLHRGHIPGSLNLPFTEVLHMEPTKLEEQFKAIGLDDSKPIITTCGSGVTAPIVSLALFYLGKQSAVYDGSWSEYGVVTDSNPIEPEPKKQ